LSIFSSKKPLITKSNDFSTVITSLPNGLKVASEEAPGHFASVGVYIDAGSRYENNQNAGSSHLIDRLAFKSTKDYTSEELVQEMEKLGGSVVAHSSRESIIYQSSIFRHDIQKILPLFSQIIRYPLLLKNDFEEVKKSTLYEIEELSQQPDMLLIEKIHEVAYNNASNGKGSQPNTVGRSMLCTTEKLKTMNLDIIKDFRKTWFSPNRMVIVGTGMSHEYLLEHVQKHFGDIPKASPEILQKQKEQTKAAKYTGGSLIINTKGQTLSNPDEMMLTHIYLAFESVNANDPDIYAVAVLNTLMGGGSSFSAGGPGKGIYSRLYTHVLNQYQFVEKCQMFNYSYNDTGLFGISLSVLSHPQVHGYVLPIIFNQIQDMISQIKPEEVNRAKNQLTSQLLMNLENRSVELEDIGRQILSNGKRVSASEMYKRIQEVSYADIVRVAHRIIFGETDTKEMKSYPDMKYTPRTGDGRPTIVIQGPFEDNDPLLKAEQTVNEFFKYKQN
jgi:processing peptidase subunit alpha